MAKCRIAPVRQLSTPQLELNGAVLSKRGRKVLEQEMRFKFEQVFQLVDSETVLCMINKVSTRFAPYEGVRVGEIQAATAGDLSSWYWVQGSSNTADWLTRGKDVLELGADSEWFRGPSFLRLPVEQWNIRSYADCSSRSDGSEVSCNTEVDVGSLGLVDYSRFGSFPKLVWTIARIYGVLQIRKFKGGQTLYITPELLERSRLWLLKDVQSSFVVEIKKKKGDYAKLHPVLNGSGLWVVGARLVRRNPLNSQSGVLPVLLPTDHHVTRLLMQQEHIESGHRGRDVTLARFRQWYWCPRGSKLANRVVSGCYKCRRVDMKLLSQVMGKLPEERLTPGPPFNNVMLDFFGPYLVRGEVQKRVSGKAYGIIFTDVCSRAVHIECAFGYDTSSFLLALQRFTSVRGWPRVIFSDPGSQLVGAEKDLVAMWQDMDKGTVYKASVEKGTQWIFGPADSPWHQGAVESLVKAAKRALRVAMGDHRLSVPEFMTVCAEVANMLNERPLGISSSDNSEEVCIVTPNSQLIGRPFARNHGRWSTGDNSKTRQQFVSSISESFWKAWAALYAPTLIHQRKWHKCSRDLKPGDIVAIADSNSLRGQYRIARVVEVFPGVDGIVRRVSVAYKNFRVGDRTYEYTGSREVVVVRSVQRLALLVPFDGPSGGE
jgi:hypothetical protein